MKRMIRCAVIVLVCLIAYRLSNIHAQETTQQQPRVIEIHAKRFSFNPAEITVAVGETVTLSLTSDDVTHGLEIPDLGVNATIPKGKVTKVDITAKQAGTFHGMCSHFCGVGHGSMVFTVLVKDK
jgi:cytochrome c oxidase subunit 2